MNPHGYIYGLFDPRDEALRYVGQTTKAPEERLKSHLCPSSLRQHSYVARWLRGLANQVLRPLVLTLDRAFSQEELDRLEVGWIAKCRAEGRHLTNLSDGGDGPWGRVVSPETRAKISEAQKGRPRKPHTEEWRRTQSVWMKAYRTEHPVSKEHLQRLAAQKLGKPLSPETRAKIAASRQANPTFHRAGTRHTEEAKAKVSRNRRGKHMGAAHHNRRHDISTEVILQRLAGGFTKVAVAKELGISPTFVHRRIAEAQKLAAEGAV